VIINQPNFVQYIWTFGYRLTRLLP